jgi:esterase/lipase
MRNIVRYDENFDIDMPTYDWSVKVFRSLKKMLKVNMKLHAESEVMQGDIFLFNHFSRFETFIPQFLIYEQTGAYSCAIASGEFFKGDKVLARYLQNVCVLPNNHQRLFSILAGQIFRGRKVIIFPEGGMVKDRSVLDKHGHYSIYSRMSMERRKHHTGAAVLAQGIEAFKATVRNAYRNKDHQQLERWKIELQLDSLDQLLMTALKPTWIIPANITFYPIRSSDNLLRQGVELFADGLSLRQTEELLIEGNIIFKDTDMDIRMGKPIDPYHVWNWWNRYLLEVVAAEFSTLDEVFNLHDAPKSWKQKLLGMYFRKNAAATRNQYMEKIYQNVTINLSHLASTLIMHCIDLGFQSIEKSRFYKTIYIAIKYLQARESSNLHRSLLNPEEYRDLIAGKSKRFEQFIKVAESSQLIKVTDERFEFLDKLCEDHDFDTIRMENLIAVYSNEVEPIIAVQEIIKIAYKESVKDLQLQIGLWYFDDACCEYQWDKRAYTKPRYEEINKMEFADAEPQPFLLRPEQANGYGVLLIHGLLASPAEVKDYGEYLQQQGYTVLGVRLKGHGTSPYELRELAWEEWYASVLRGYNILNYFCDQLLVIGFSTGGALALKLVAENMPNIKAVVSLTMPIKFVDQTIMLVPLLHGTNKLVRWISSFEGIKPFIENKPEHTHINYYNTPIRSLYELRRLIQEVEGLLPKVLIPTLSIFADKDPIVAIESAKIMMKKLGTEEKHLEIIKADHHGILMDNTGGTWEAIDNFIAQYCPA